MTTNKTNQPTTERTTEQIMRDLELARLMQEPVHIDRLTAELKDHIDVIFHTRNYIDPIATAQVEAIAEDADRNTVTVELAHREALAEDAFERGDWSAFCAQVAPGKAAEAAEARWNEKKQRLAAAEVEAAHVEALADDADRTRYPDIYPGTRKSNPEQA